MEDILRALIKDHPKQSIGYDTFIDYSLYHEKYGYYQKGGVKVGKEGDFYTSSMIHKVFAHIFADYFYNTSRRLNMPLAICEIGGGDGTFAREVINRLSLTTKDFTYHLIEKSPYHREKIKEGTDTDYLSLYHHLDEFKARNPYFEGIVFSNEWLDAQPVKVVEIKDGIPMEIRIALDESEDFIEIYYPLTVELADFVKTYNLPLREEGQRMEIPGYMETLAKELDSMLHKGVIVTVDYGYRNAEWQHPARKKGSLRGYYQHRLIYDVLQLPGMMDITHHLHWDVWKAIGKKMGWENGFIIKQNDFLLRSGIMDELITHTNPDPFSEESKKNRAIRTLITGEGFSEAFDVVVQAKKVTIPAI
ncbi:SAM-dependent methyltransferase [Thalassobacillus sp. B23F22_16]|uniref:SAM-dependent methyltransferase n=1 Tax=Thalassobacillus sp. B23F22_16 TaxID=3459513 RepID=UPI00373F1EFE